MGKANLDDVKGVGGVFMMLLEGIVVGVGALMCAIGSWFAHKFYKGEKLPFELLAPPSAAEEAAICRAARRTCRSRRTSPTRARAYALALPIPSAWPRRAPPRCNGFDIEVTRLHDD